LVVDIVIIMHHNDEDLITKGQVMPERGLDSESAKDRFTVTFGPGQRAALQGIADRLNAPLAFVVRFALAEFIEGHRDAQLSLPFPRLPGPGSTTEES